MKTYPWTAEATKSMWVGVVPVVQLDVVITTVGFLLHLKCDEAELDAVALLSCQQPLAVSVTGVIVVSKLWVWVEVLVTSICFQTTSTLCNTQDEEWSDFMIYMYVLLGATRGRCCTYKSCSHFADAVCRHKNSHSTVHTHKEWDTIALTNINTSCAPAHRHTPVECVAWKPFLCTEASEMKRRYILFPVETRGSGILFPHSRPKMAAVSLSPSKASRWSYAHSWCCSISNSLKAWGGGGKNVVKIVPVNTLKSEVCEWLINVCCCQYFSNTVSTTRLGCTHHRPFKATVVEKIYVTLPSL